MENQKSFLEYISGINIKENTVIAIGNFDGLHLGHMELIKKAIKMSKQESLRSIVFSYQIHPQNIISNSKVELLMTNDEKKRILYSYGIDDVLLVPFDDNLKNTSAYEFCDEILVKKLRVKVLVLGEDASFGKERLPAIKIKDYLESKGVRVYLIPLILLEDVRISSSLIRKKIKSGEIEEANKYLGRNFKIIGEVVHGKKRGSTELGFPTANIKIPKNQILPPEGVYSTKINYNGKIYNGATNIGKNPTFGENQLTIESYIINFDKIIYGEVLEVEFIRKIRDEIKFSGKEELIYQMKKDIDKIIKNV